MMSIKDGLQHVEQPGKSFNSLVFLGERKGGRDRVKDGWAGVFVFGKVPTVGLSEVIVVIARG